MIRRPPRSTRVRSSAASDVYKRQVWRGCCGGATSPPSAASDLTIGFDRSVLAKLASCLTASTDVRDRHEYSRRVQPEVPPRGAQAAEGWLRRTGTTPRQCAVALARGGRPR